MLNENFDCSLRGGFDYLSSWNKALFESGGLEAIISVARGPLHTRTDGLLEQRDFTPNDLFDDLSRSMTVTYFNTFRPKEKTKILKTILTNFFINGGVSQPMVTSSPWSHESQSYTHSTMKFTHN